MFICSLLTRAAATSPDAHGLRRNAGSRLELVESRLVWEGGANRSGIVESPVASDHLASKDMTPHEGFALDNFRYGQRVRGGEVVASVQQHLLDLSAKRAPLCVVDRLKSTDTFGVASSEAAR